MIQKIKQAILSFLTIFLIFSQAGLAQAIDIPTAPDAPSAPSAPVPPSAPTAPEQPVVPSDPGLISTTPMPTTNDTIVSQQSTSTPTPTPTITQLAGSNQSGTGNQFSNGNSGSTLVQTGDALNSANVTTSTNSNLPPANTSGTVMGSSATNISNGASSNNQASTNTTKTQDTSQANDVSLTNNLYQSTVTGHNSASLNVGDSAIISGDANTTGTVLSSLNTNIDSVKVAQFNVVDDHRGDVILDFNNNSTCVIGCTTTPTSVQNIANGSSSTNEASSSATLNQITDQTNNANLGNDLTLNANSGNNNANLNTDGQTMIQSGNANVAANALSFVNNNIAGAVFYGVVNIFGKLIGDIILPDPATIASASSATNNSNGASSTNTASLDQKTATATFQNNDASIENNLTLSAQTGDNNSNLNTGGTTSIQTGQANTDIKTLNVVNSNIDGNIWLVIVNKAGLWIGQILGAPAGALMAAPSGTNFTVNNSGEITASNNDNGANSQNIASSTSETTNNVNQNNQAKIVNNLNLSTNTGQNSASNNTGGNTFISTGKANIIANLVNFVNNNISGNGKLLVAVVNVFGSWVGDFVTPGTHQEQKGSNEPSSSGNNQTAGNTDPLETADQNSQNTNNSSQISTHASNLTFTAWPQTINHSIYPPFQPLIDPKTTEQTKVLGQNIIKDFNFNPITRTQNKKLEINLAWLVILMPASILLFLLVRKINQLRLKNS